MIESPRGEKSQESNELIQSVTAMYKPRTFVRIKALKANIMDVKIPREFGGDKITPRGQS
jgi:hypothetical protein